MPTDYDSREQAKFSMNSSGDTSVRVTSESLIMNEDVQHPIPTNGDSIYAKDINVDLSTAVGWTDEDSQGVNKVLIPFTDLQTRLHNSTSDSPKVLYISFKRTINAHQVGIGSVGTGENFSNVRISLLGSGNTERTVLDECDNNEKYDSRNYEFEPQLFNALKLEFCTTDPVCVSNITIQKACEVEASIKAKSQLTNNIENINSYKNALQVDDSLVHEKGVNLFFFRDLDTSTTLAEDALRNDTSVSVVDSTGFVVGDKIRVTTDVDVGQSFLFVTDVTGSVLTIDRPLSVGVSSGSTVTKVSTSLNVVGSLENPIIFKIVPPNSTLSLRWQLTRMLIHLESVSTMDDGLFGSLPSLTNGLNIRVIKGDGTYRDITNWKNNGDMANDMYDVTYTSKAPSGQYGLRGRWTFTKAQFHVDLRGASGDYFEIRIQDDLSVLEDFEVKCQGRLFGG